MSLRRLRRHKGGCIIRKIESPHNLSLNISSSTWRWDAMVSINNNDIEVNDSIKFYSHSSYPDLSSLSTTIIGNMRDLYLNKSWNTDDSDTYIYWLECIYYSSTNSRYGVICLNLGTNGKRIYEDNYVFSYNSLEGIWHIGSGGIDCYNIRIIPFRHHSTDSYSLCSRLTRLSLQATATCGTNTETNGKRILSEWNTNVYRAVTTYLNQPIGYIGNPALNHAFVSYSNGQIGYPEINGADDYVTSNTLLITNTCKYTKFNW